MGVEAFGISSPLCALEACVSGARGEQRRKHFGFAGFACIWLELGGMSWPHGSMWAPASKQPWATQVGSGRRGRRLAPCGAGFHVCFVALWLSAMAFAQFVPPPLNPTSTNTDTDAAPVGTLWFSFRHWHHRLTTTPSWTGPKQRFMFVLSCWIGGVRRGPLGLDWRCQGEFRRDSDCHRSPSSQRGLVVVMRCVLACSS